jgi:hypothetical protein
LRMEIETEQPKVRQSARSRKQVVSFWLAPMRAVDEQEAFKDFDEVVW